MFQQQKPIPIPEGGPGGPLCRQAAQAACQAACQAAVRTHHGVPLLHQPPHGLDALVHGHQLPENPHVSRTQPGLRENGAVG